MSIAVWKTILTVAKTASVVLILGSALLFWRQHKLMGETWAAPMFAPDIELGSDWVIANTKDLGLMLGRFQREQPKTEKPVEKEVKPDIIGALAEYGEITDAIVVYPPYEEGGYVPAIIFHWKPGKKPAGQEGDTRTIRLGEALIERSIGPNTGVPLRLQFIGCERDAEHPGFTYFRFDMNCDGSDIQKVHWKLEEPAKEQPKPAEPTASGPGPLTTDKIHIGEPLEARAVEAPSPPPEQVQPVPVPEEPVVKEPVVVEQAPTGSMFEEEDGVLSTTSEGADYLERNYEKILEDTRTERYRDGIRIVGIANQSVANQFGIRKDDVIVRINGTPVADKSDAVNVVKGELKKKVRIIKVTIRRAGREFDRSFDTRDPATRRAAKKGFGGR